LKPADSIPLPEFAHVPGKTPRHDDAAFAAFHESVCASMGLAEIEASLAWRAGWVFVENEYFWEAHEVLEPVWMALPEGSAEKQFVQAVIQLANAELKARMGKPRAVLRLCGIVATLLESAARDQVMGLPRSALTRRVDALRRRHGQVVS
jgi:hypothetical protein